MGYKGQPTKKQVESVLREIDSWDKDTIFPTDQELEARRRLCITAYEINVEGSKKIGCAVNVYSVMQRYFRVHGFKFDEDIRKCFDCDKEYDLFDANSIFNMLNERNLIELTIGKPRQGRCDFYPFYTPSEVDLIHRKIKEKRDREA